MKSSADTSMAPLSRVLETMADGLIIFDRSGFAVTVNAAAERLLALQRKDVIGVQLSDVLLGKGAELIARRIQQSIGAKKIAKFEAPIVARKVWLSVSVYDGEDGALVYLRDSTDSHVAHRALRSSDARLRQLVENLPAGAVFVTGEIVQLNKAAEDLLGWTRDEIKSLEDWFMLTLGDAARARAELDLYRRARGTKHLSAGKFSLFHRNGELRVIEVAAYTEGHEEVWILHDLTEVTEAQEKFRILFQNADTAHFLMDNDWIVDCNTAAAKMLRLGSPQEIIGRTPREFTAERQPHGLSYSDLTRRVHNGVTRTGSYKCEVFRLRADGTEFPAYAEFTLLDIGSKQHILGTWIDLTEQKEAQRIVEKREEEYRSILENSTEIIYSVDLEGRFMFLSQSWARHTGYEVSEAEGRTFEDFIHPSDYSRAMAYYRRLRTRPIERGKLQYRLLHKNGSVRYHETSCSLVRDGVGKPTHFVGVATDITDRREAAIANARLAHELQSANRALIDARDEALESVRVKSQFLATVSHEIRTPLNGVMGMASLLKQLNLDEQERECVDTIESSGETLLRVIDDVLDFSKMEAGKLVIEPQPLELVPILDGVVSLFRGLAVEKSLELTADWSRLAGLSVMADGVRLKQVLGNLIGNAIKFTHIGGVHVAGEKTASDDEMVKIRLSVRDTGIGIPENRLASIFDSFTQADSTTQRTYGGTGLGLTISRRLIELMGGSLLVESEFGKGSCFSIELPLKVTRLPSTVKAKGLGDGGLFTGVRAMVVEDNEVNVLVAARLLQRLGCEVETVSDSGAAVEMVLAALPDVVLMDVQMPGKDGLQVTRELRARGFVKPIVALTATALQQDRDACQAAGMDEFVAKPIRVEDLVAVLDRFRSEFAS